MIPFKMLIGFEYSGIVRDAFLSAGFDAISCDLKPTESPGPHIVGDVFELINEVHFDAAIFHPPCTFVAKCQAHRIKPGNEFYEKMLAAVEDIKRLYYSPIRCVAIENPIGFASTYFRPPDQIIYPWMFGDPHSKDICLWLKNIPPLISTIYNTKRQPVANHVNGRMSTEQKSHIKSKFFPKVAAAMAHQWSKPLIDDIENFYNSFGL